VTVTPDVNKINVFNNGIFQGENVSIPKGGHTFPNWIEGDKLKWKNPQKNEKKNIISVHINKIKPIRNPRETASVWWPSPLSIQISLIHCRKVITKLINAIDTNKDNPGQFL